MTVQSQSQDTAAISEPEVVAPTTHHYVIERLTELRELPIGALAKAAGGPGKPVTAWVKVGDYDLEMDHARAALDAYINAVEDGVVDGGFYRVLRNSFGLTVIDEFFIEPVTTLKIERASYYEREAA